MNNGDRLVDPMDFENGIDLRCPSCGHAFPFAAVDELIESRDKHWLSGAATAEMAVRHQGGLLGPDSLAISEATEIVDHYMKHKEHPMWLTEAIIGLLARWTHAAVEMTEKKMKKKRI